MQHYYDQPWLLVCRQGPIQKGKGSPGNKTNIINDITYQCELSHVVECPQGIELLQGQDERLCWGAVHEVKVDEVIDPQTL